MIAQEFILEPVIVIGKFADQGLARRIGNLAECSISTPKLEFLHCMLKLLQDQQLLFQRPQRSNPNEHADFASNVTHSQLRVQWDSESLLSKIFKPKLFQFFQTGFNLVAQNHVQEQVRLCDLAKLYVETLAPWTP